MLPVDEVMIDPAEVNNIGLGESIYTRKQLDEFAQFQDSQGTRKAYLAKTAELAYRRRTGDSEWGLGLSTAAQSSIIDIVGASFFPLYSVRKKKCAVTKNYAVFQICRNTWPRHIYNVFSSSKDRSACVFQCYKRK
jgi:hypothetical protein